MSQEVVIAELSRYRHFTETVVAWIISEWGGVSQDYEDTLQATDAPPALVATDTVVPLGVLSFKRHNLQGHSSNELWINALYVSPPARGQGLGRALVKEAINAAQGRNLKALYVYTDIPAYYESMGWQHVSSDEDSDMCVLKYQPGP